MCRAENADRLLGELIAVSEAENKLLATGADIAEMLAGEEKLRLQLAAELAGLTAIPGKVAEGLRCYLAVKEAGIVLAREQQGLTRALLAEVEQARVQANKIVGSRAPARFIDQKG